MRELSRRAGLFCPSFVSFFLFLLFYTLLRQWTYIVSVSKHWYVWQPVMLSFLMFAWQQTKSAQYPPFYGGGRWAGKLFSTHLNKKLPGNRTICFIAKWDYIQKQNHLKKIIMKTFIFLFVLFIILGACRKEGNETLQTPAIEKSATIMTESQVNPNFGKPNSTMYYFKVTDLSGILPLSVKLFERATGTITYLPMTRIGTSWILSTKITNNGWYDWRYVYSVTKGNISTNAYILCNSNNTFSSTGISSISWPFGADGSSWNTRTVLINGTSQTWRGGEETKGTSYHLGYGWNEVTHINTDEQYSDDWNRGTGSQDLGAEIRSPLDGYVDTYGTYTTSVGASLFVSIVQQASNGTLYRFYVGHLQSWATNVYSGKYVRAGIDKIGTLGTSGATSPHAHTSLRDISNNANSSVKFYFTAQ